MIPSDLKEVSRHYVDRCLNQAQTYFDYPFSYDELCFNLRGKSAGQFVVTDRRLLKLHHKLRFNSALLEKYRHEFIELVIPHECAHLVVFQFYGKETKGQRVLPHGKQWKQVMRDVFELEPIVRHQFEVEQKPKQSFLYRCGCQGREHELTIIRHNKIRKNKARYVCRDCKAGLLPMTTA